MIKKLSLNGGILTLNNQKYKIFQFQSNGFKIVIDKNIYICFEAEGKNGGLYFDIKSLIRNNRVYKAKIYFYHYIPLIREISFILCLNNYLWDYGASKPLMDSREENGHNQNLSDYCKSLIGAIYEV